MTRHPPKMTAVPHRPSWPVIPTSVTLAAGRVRIVQVENPEVPHPRTGKKIPVMGFFQSQPRRIVLRRTCDTPTKWAVLLHEMTHAALYDTGARHGLSGQQEECVCEAVALAFMHQIRFVRGLQR